MNIKVVARYQARFEALRCPRDGRRLIPVAGDPGITLRCAVCGWRGLLAVGDYQRIREFMALVDIAEGERLKEAGMAAAAKAVDVAWRERFDRRVEVLAMTGEMFTSEDVTAEVGLPPSGSVNAIGARMAAAARRGVIVRLGDVKARRPNRHAARVSQWAGA